MSSNKCTGEKIDAALRSQIIEELKHSDPTNAAKACRCSRDLVIAVAEAEGIHIPTRRETNAARKGQRVFLKQHSRSRRT